MMAEFPALPLWTDSFIADTIHLDAAETGAYIMLLMVAWRRPTNDLPNDEKQLAKFTRCGLKQWRRISPSVMSFWTLEDGAWRQKKLDKVRRTVTLQTKQKSAAGKASALKRQQTQPTGVDEPYQQPKPKPKPKPDLEEEQAKACLSKPRAFDPAPFVEVWNSVCVDAGLPRVTGLKDQRRVKAIKRWREDFGSSVERWGEFCRKIAAAPHLTGDNDRGWRASLGWVIEPNNLTKIQEGNYDNDGRKQCDPALGAARILGLVGGTMAPDPFDFDGPPNDGGSGSVPSQELLVDPCGEVRAERIRQGLFGSGRGKV